ncbi:transposase [Desulfoluna spongiiphila]|uniref:Putative transposase n=1 Tax=Desulfoluna spongiiphila TaxID=419481 RepID=A0A1G5G9R1_9BACT|nr:transposase [Desulfoluna spongiiphila]SCY48234.1 putative transposase [Desulfoluna spongiiphila]
MTGHGNTASPHHVIQRGVDGQPLFFSDDDYADYIRIIAEACRQRNVRVWGYCLMPDHIHLIAVTEEPATLDACLHEATLGYTACLAQRNAPVVPSFKERPARHALDETYLIRCARYVEINPVKRNYVRVPEAWAFSSAAAHISGKDDALVTVAPLLDRVRKNWSDFLATPIPSEEADLFYAHEQSGKPMVRKPSDSTLTQ